MWKSDLRITATTRAFLEETQSIAKKARPNNIENQAHVRNNLLGVRNEQKIVPPGGDKEVGGTEYAVRWASRGGLYRETYFSVDFLERGSAANLRIMIGSTMGAT